MSKNLYVCQEVLQLAIVLIPLHLIPRRMPPLSSNINCHFFLPVLLCLILHRLISSVPHPNTPYLERYPDLDSFTSAILESPSPPSFSSLGLLFYHISQSNLLMRDSGKTPSFNPYPFASSSHKHTQTAPIPPPLHTTLPTTSISWESSTVFPSPPTSL